MKKNKALSIILGFLLPLLLSSCSVNFFSFSLSPQKEPLEESVIRKSTGYTVNKVLLIDISGEITSESSEGMFSQSENSVDKLKEVLDTAKKDKNIKAVILRINSPGGEVSASDLMYNELMNFKKETNKKVYSLFMDTAASGAYYIAMASDKIYAIPTTITGSIGVIFMIPNIQNTMNKIGFEMRVFKSGAKKDIGSIWRASTPEEEKLIQSVIDSMYGRFFSIVSKNRSKVAEDKLKALADGSIFTADKALENGLIDEIAYPDQAFEQIRVASGLDDYKLVTYKSKFDYKANYYSKTNPPDDASAKTEINLLKINNPRSFFMHNPRFYYLWMPH